MDKGVTRHKASGPRPPLAAIVYGAICLTLAIIGIVLAVIGMVMYFASDGYLNKSCLLESLWEGQDVETIWETCSGFTSVPDGHWYLSLLSNGDAIAMLGIAIAALAAVVGMWGAFVGMLRSREWLFALLGLVVAVILTASATGVLCLE